MITVKYDPFIGQAIQDGLACDVVDEAIIKSRTENVYLVVGNSLVLDLFRLRVAQGNLSPNSVVFCDSYGQVWDVNEYGCFDKNAPDCISIDTAFKILKAATDKIRAKRIAEKVAENEKELYLESCSSLSEIPI